MLCTPSVCEISSQSVSLPLGSICHSKFQQQKSCPPFVNYLPKLRSTQPLMLWIPTQPNYLINVLAHEEATKFIKQ